ncbi:hypothetical protein TRFO_30211 [Tritrichomonas foetus]|uniref:Uncharacterized protein n=1 Tax=Tritrichomonas foetus TaxID=1144522 RepID=A0A1J4JVB9_9EUKA|nr:hypothetical protein TRFO_30211 [Tritrichomonas foetus]|eukprot:OHT02666.1 hypothetical protein TRFO_30211 [Tritrichomonas foetus]
MTFVCHLIQSDPIFMNQQMKYQESLYLDDHFNTKKKMPKPKKNETHDIGKTHEVIMSPVFMDDVCVKHDKCSTGYQQNDSPYFSSIFQPDDIDIPQKSRTTKKSNPINHSSDPSSGKLSESRSRKRIPLQILTQADLNSRKSRNNIECHLNSDFSDDHFAGSPEISKPKFDVDESRHKKSNQKMKSSLKTKSAPVSPTSHQTKKFNPKFRKIGQSLHGSNLEGTHACHVLSIEVANEILTHTKGRMFSDRVQEQIMRQLNSNDNLVIKPSIENYWGKDGKSGDRYYDGVVIQALRSKNPNNFIIQDDKVIDRILRIWRQISNLRLPASFKGAAREQLSQFVDHRGNKIIHPNSPIDNYY